MLKRFIGNWIRSLVLSPSSFAGLSENCEFSVNSTCKGQMTKDEGLMKKIGELLNNFSRILLGKKMIIAKSQKDLDKMREVGELIAEVREALRKMIEPGVTTLEL